MRIGIPARLAARLSRSRRGLSLVNAAVIRPDGTIGTSVRVARGRIAGLDEGVSRGDLVLDCEGAVVLPGLVNAHDHLELNSFGRLKWRERYDNVGDWIADFQPRFATDPALAANRPETLDDRLLVGALKNLLCGATTVCHHNPLYPSIRNGFPVRVVKRFGWSHSLLVDGAGVRASYARTPAHWPWIVHAAEGADARAASEFGELDRLGCVGPNTVLVHGVGLRPADRRRALARGCALVWCPSSNQFLFGTTADVGGFSSRGRLALGTDSRLSGDGDLLDELRVARTTGLVSARDLVRAVTGDAAHALRLRRAGELVAGAAADLTVIAPLGRDPFESAVSARRSDVRLVLVEARPVVGDRDMAPVFEAAGIASVPAVVDGRRKLVASAIADRVRHAVIRESGLELES
jgi:cytosine/adenosine deaminase-related metal-dependent hydrolase